jgi:ribulose-phosphate 3-epimerase
VEHTPDRPGTNRLIEIAPSVLPADFARLGQAVSDLADAGVDRIQFDVMDGRFVPNLTFGADTIASVRRHTDVPFEAHLMVHEPSWLIPGIVDAGCRLVIVHAEACTHLHRVVGQIREAGAAAAVALNPATPPDAVTYVLDQLEMVLCMTVNPGFGGQAYIPEVEPKIAALRHEIVARGLDVDLEVDGGIGPDTVAAAAAAGTNVLVAGSALFRDPDGLGNAVQDLRRRATAAVA